MSSFDKQAGSRQFFGFASFAPQLFGMPSFIYVQAILEAHFEKKYAHEIKLKHPLLQYISKSLTNKQGIDFNPTFLF